jgi:hypothetical protein
MIGASIYIGFSLYPAMAVPSFHKFNDALLRKRILDQMARKRAPERYVRFVRAFCFVEKMVSD